MNKIQFLDNNGTFSIAQPENYSYLYFPVAGEKGIKSSLTPNLGGDSKLNQNAFLMEPVSSENLHNNRSGRNFWCHIKGIGSWSLVGQSAEQELKKFTPEQDESKLTAGFMWHMVERTSEKYCLHAEVLSFVPVDSNVEVMQVRIHNSGEEEREITPVAAIPIYGRSADNIRDHRHVSSLLHRIRTTDYGVYVKPTLSFDERGHQVNHLTYFVCGVSGEGEKPEAFYPTVESFIGEGGSYTNPRAINEAAEGIESGICEEGKEAFGGIRFQDVSLKPGEHVTYTILLGATENEQEISEIIKKLDTAEKVREAFEQTKNYWKHQVNVHYHTGNAEFDNYMQWVSFQPILRRIYGCSFLPHHDYGKGGRGWRDLWQDCLALLIMNPNQVRQMILDNYGGVRVDGTNATIIGEKQGEFIADRNNITRVWMDHGMWPFLTTKLYMDQTGDVEILNQPVVYFKDRQILRGTAVDEEWDDAYGKMQKDVKGEIYKGTVLEHLILQHLCAFYDVGEHNHIRLRGADWNDALDMAEQRGESVAFTCAYAGNLKQLARYIRILKRRYGQQNIELMEEMAVLFCNDTYIYADIDKKHAILKKYEMQCKHQISGAKIQLDLEYVAKNLEEKAEWMMQHIRDTEWISDENGGGWFNSYYDNHGRAVEGIFESGVRMMLTGQVFAIMSKTARPEQMKAVCESAYRYLYDEKTGGYRLNTNFREEKYDMGRMFGFAYGEKENGAVFSHMTVMYANALYQNGFVEEGHRALQTLADTALNFEVSRIYPGIPEYFNAQGRGMYHYLTGAASWYMLTMITEVFGVQGEVGDLVLEPKLLKNQFDEEGWAGIQVNFAGKAFDIRYHNRNRKSYGDYVISEIVCEEELAASWNNTRASIGREKIDRIKSEICRIVVELE
ncbi:MAG: cellobiose phosphorylase [Clostridiales bacterium]|nr:cellobiose phosphorylase [Clostridiales bacterium]